MRNIIIIIAVLIFTSHSNSQWVRVTNGLGGINVTVYTLAANSNAMFAGNYGGVYKTTNNGSSWIQTPLNNRYVGALTVNTISVFAGSGGVAGPYYGVYMSTNNGTNWIQTSLNNRNIYSLAANGNNIFAGTGGLYGVYSSTDNGANWNQTLLNNRSVTSLAINGNNVFAGTAVYGVYLSTDNGISWSQTSLNNRSVNALFVNGNDIFAGTLGYGIYLSTNNGANWSQTALNNVHIYSLAVNGNTIFAGTGGLGVYVSNNYGASWVQRNEGFGNYSSQIFACSILNSYIFVGADSGGVYRRPLVELTGINPVLLEIPNQFSLSQNYPNPFNPTTQIRFSIPLSRGVTAEGSQGVLVNLTIYDAMGRVVETLHNGELTPGTYEADWNASKYPSGVYFYKFSTANFTQTKKMVLIK